MIIKLLMDLLYSVFSVLTLPIKIPGMPDSVREFVAVSIDYISTGISLLGNFVDIGFLLILFGIIIAVDVGILLYKLVMWVLKKIPMLGIE